MPTLCTPPLPVSIACSNICQALRVAPSLVSPGQQFLEADLKTPLPRKLTFTDPEKIRELARREEAWGTSEARQMLEYAIDVGRGGIYLRLTPEQYAKLRAKGRKWHDVSD
jgi:hypothetical protein